MAVTIATASEGDITSIYSFKTKEPVVLTIIGITAATPNPTHEDRGVDPVDDGRSPAANVRPAERTNHALERIIGLRR